MARIRPIGSGSSTNDKNKATTGSYGVRDLDADVASGPDMATGYVNIDAISKDNDPGSEDVSNTKLDPNATVSQVGGMLQFNRNFSVSDLTSGDYSDANFTDPTTNGTTTTQSNDAPNATSGDTSDTSTFNFFNFTGADGEDGGGGGDGTAEVPGMGGDGGLMSQIVVGVIASIGAFLVLDALGKKD